MPSKRWKTEDTCISTNMSCVDPHTPYLHVCNQPKMKCRVILAFGGGGSGGSCHSGSGSSDGSSVHNSVLLKTEIETCRGRCSDHAGAALFRQPPCANESSDSCGTNALRTTNSQSRVHDWFVSQPAQGGHSDWIRDLAWYSTVGWIESTRNVEFTTLVGGFSYRCNAPWRALLTGRCCFSYCSRVNKITWCQRLAFPRSV